MKTLFQSYRRLNPRDSLQFRVTLALTMFVAFVVSAMLLALFTINDQLKANLLNGILDHEMSELISEYPTEGQGAIPHSANLTGYVVAADQVDTLPAAMRDLPPHVRGVTLEFNDHSYRVGTSMIGNKRAYLAYNITVIENQEALFKIVMIAAALIVLALAIPLGIWIARVSLKPINALAEHVGNLHPDVHTTPLADRFDGYEVGMIAGAFDRFMQRLDQFVERERSFTADASHELRTPLAVIQGAVEVLQQDPARAASAPLTRIDRASRQMAELIEALLFLARDEPTEVDGATPQCRADQVVNEVVDAYRPLIGGKQVNIAALESCEVDAPRVALVIVFGNLLRNALRHGGPDIQIVLAQGRLSVADNGAGMNTDQLRRAFDRGYRDGPDAGLGLGLYLVKRVTDRYGWRVRLASRPAEGTRIELQLT